MRGRDRRHFRSTTWSAERSLSSLEGEGEADVGACARLCVVDRGAAGACRLGARGRRPRGALPAARGGWRGSCGILPARRSRVISMPARHLRPRRAWRDARRTDAPLATRRRGGRMAGESWPVNSDCDRCTVAMHRGDCGRCTVAIQRRRVQRACRGGHHTSPVLGGGGGG